MTVKIYIEVDACPVKEETGPERRRRWSAAEKLEMVLSLGRSSRGRMSATPLAGTSTT